MSSLKKVVLLIVTLLVMMQLNIGLANGNNGSISIPIVKVSTPVTKSGTLGNSNGALNAWIIQIGLGPGGAQQFNALVDTGKSDLVVVDRSCRTFWCQSVVVTRYNSGLSPNTFFDTRSAVTVSYLAGVAGSRRVTGITTQDEFTLIGATPTRTIGKQDFIRISTAEGFFAADSYDAILGLAPGTNARNRLSVIENFSARNFINSRIFSFRTTGGVTSLDIGNVPVPADPQTLLTYTNLARSGEWSFNAQLDLETVGPVTRRIKTSARFQIQTIVPNIGVPLIELKIIADRLGATQNRLTGLFEFNCALNVETTNLVFTISRQRFLIPNANFITVDANNGNICRLNLFQTPKDVWILGQNFLSVIDTVFDATNRRIGFFN